MDAVMVVEHLAKRYGDLEAVADVSVGVQQGEIFGIHGPNGAGKTTFVECVQGLRTPDSGRVDVLGLAPTCQASALRQRTRAQLQEPSLPQRLRVGEALALFSSFQAGGPPWRSVMHDWGLEAKEKAAFGIRPMSRTRSSRGTPRSPSARASRCASWANSSTGGALPEKLRAMRVGLCALQQLIGFLVAFLSLQVVTSGTEIGWRGYLTEKLLPGRGFWETGWLVGSCGRSGTCLSS